MMKILTIYGCIYIYAQRGIPWKFFGGGLPMGGGTKSDPEKGDRDIESPGYKVTRLADTLGTRFYRDYFNWCAECKSKIRVPKYFAKLLLVA